MSKFSVQRITFVIAVNNWRVFRENFLSSPVVRQPHPHQVLVQEGFASAARAYNDALDRALHDLVVFCHQDIYLPEPWMGHLESSLRYLETHDPDWGVLGCYGETLHDHGRGYIYASGRGMMGKPFERPSPIQTLDEIVLVLRRSSGLRFDDALPHFHLYGTDICMRAAEQGKQNYAIPAFCIHNTQQLAVLPKEFYQCCRHIRKTWRGRLPIQTTCMRITPSGIPAYRRRLREAYLRYIRRAAPSRQTRTESIEQILRQLEPAILAGSTR